MKGPEVSALCILALLAAMFSAALRVVRPVWLLPEGGCYFVMHSHVLLSIREAAGPRSLDS